ncbi:MAG TPA: ATP synthase subunit I [Desulfuromonadales bacterium]|nr:ATP synthase subunit I [Desulfuromonadales bacterium]
MTPIEDLPAQMHRRSWLILGGMLLASLPFGNAQLSFGILCGGLVAIGGFIWLRRSLRQLLADPDAGGKARYKFGYLVRLATLALVLALLVAEVKVHAVGLIIGLSVMVINIFWTTIQQVLLK